MLVDCCIFIVGNDFAPQSCQDLFSSLDRGRWSLQWLLSAFQWDFVWVHVTVQKKKKKKNLLISRGLVHVWAVTINLLAIASTEYESLYL